MQRRFIDAISFLLISLTLIIGEERKSYAQVTPCIVSGFNLVNLITSDSTFFQGPFCGCDGNTYTVDTAALSAGVTHYTYDACGTIPPCHADFTYTINGYSIDFIDSSSGDIDPNSYNWDFDGDYSYVQNPTYNYAGWGWTIVTLGIGDLSGTYWSETTRIIWVPVVGGCISQFELAEDTAVQHHWWAFNDAGGNHPLDYLWSWGDGAFSSGATPSHIYSTPGYYAICLTVSDSFGCSNTYCDSSNYISKIEEDNSMISVTVVTELPNSVPHISSSENSISIFPNPAASQLTVSSEQLAAFDIQIVDVLGNEIYESKNNLNSQLINLKSFSPGVYFVKARNQNGEIQVKKFVKG